MWYVSARREIVVFLRGTDYFSQATNYQRKYTKRKILFLLFLLVIGMFIFLIVKPKRLRAPDPSPPSPQDDPIGRLGVARPETEIEAPGPDVVTPNGVSGG